MRPRVPSKSKRTRRVPVSGGRFELMNERPIRVMTAGLAVSVLLAGCTDASPGADESSATPSMTPSTTTPTAFSVDSYQPPERSAAELSRIFSYEQRAPLAVEVRGRTQRKAGARIQTLTYADGSGGRADALLVAPLEPPGESNAGVVFGYGYGGSRGDFLDEAVALAARGVVSVLPSTETKMTPDADADVETLRRSVVLERRAFDLLVARPDVDADRLAFVGHSWGAIRAAVHAGVEKRLAAVCYAGFGLYASRYALEWGGSQHERRYLDSASRFDPSAYLGMPGRRAVLLQFAEYDENDWPDSDYATLERVTAPPVERLDYPINHEDLREEAKPMRDRAAFLTRELRLGSSG